MIGLILTCLPQVQHIKFLGISIDSNLSWKHYIEDITPRLNKACFAIRSIKHFMSVEAMRFIYFSYFHSIVSYGIIFWGNSVHSKYIFNIQKEPLELLQILEQEFLFMNC